MMTLDAFETALVRYGTDLDTWPHDTAVAARALLDQSREARILLSEEEQLSGLLIADRTEVRAGAVDAVRAQLVAAAHRLPQETAGTQRPLSLGEALAGVFRLPRRIGIVVMPAASLASAALLGFLVGWAQIATQPSAQETFDLTQLAFGADTTAWSYSDDGTQ